MSSAPSIFLRRFLAGGAALGAAWWFHSHGIVPLRQREVEIVQALADVRQRLSEARIALREIGEQEQKTAHARGSLDSVLGDAPKEPTVVWLPVKLRTHLSRGGVTEVAIRLNSAVPEPVAGGYERTYWHLNLPRQDGMRTMSEFLLAVAEIEQEPCLKILDVSFVCAVEEPHWPAGGCNVSALVRK